MKNTEQKNRMTAAIWDSSTEEDRFRLIASVYYFDALMNPAPFKVAAQHMFAELHPKVQGILLAHWGK